MQPRTKRVGLSITLALTLLLSAQAQAQLLPLRPSFVYAAQFVCGYVQGATPPQANSPGATVPAPLPDDFQPGSYATALNLFNPSFRSVANIRMFASVADGGTTPVGPPITLAAFRTEKITCQDIVRDVARLIPGNLANGEVVEGFLYTTRPADDLEMQAVYTYSTKDGFKEFLGVDDAGFVVPVAGREAETEFPLISIGGAGGLGLGGSIDVEKITPRKVSGLIIQSFPNP